MQRSFKFYLQTFTAALFSSCHATLVAPASHIVPNPEAYPNLCSQPFLLPASIVLVDLQEEVEQQLYL